ncbi:MAG: PSD1 domain-containing protein [Verrucomicrobiaceae bacterium]|nr:PSD1 domain-containing protein [Verrucomicrobiaceae bacterium]
MSRLAPLLCLLATTASSRVPDFSREILPILSDNCFQCHGTDAKARKGELRLDVEADAKRVKDGVAAIKPGNADASEAIKRIVSTDKDEHMPPAKSHKNVTPAQLELLKQWINGGAKWGQHWAFTRIEKPKTGNGIDDFVAAKLKEHGLAFSPEAAPETLCRRLYLDLVGLPPTPQEVAEFVKVANGTAKAYETLVDKLLSDPRHGERWVWEWLDASRYADTNGYQGDLERTAWPWRDWVIKAINDNLPYDQFTVWQLAGDLLPNATKEQKLATAFVRNHMINGEGGRIAEENRIEYLFDQVETVGTVWLGLTFQCTRCHDHKFDPLTMVDYYSMMAFFNATQVDGGGRSGQTAPVLDMSTPTEEAKSQQAQQRVNQIAKEVEAFELKKWPRPEGKGLEESEAAKLPGNLPATLAKTVPSKRGVDALLESINYFKDKDKAYVAVLQKLLNAVRQRDAAKSNITKVMVMEERKEGPRDTFLLVKGAYDNVTTTKASMATPAKLPPMPANAPRNRLGLAQWLVSRDNPLTARVTVNRYWQSFFGTGLVKTAEDFGLQGERPVHMDLLDWLAADFMDHGWDVKRLLKMIVTSRTYRQAGGAKSEELRAKSGEQALQNPGELYALRASLYAQFPRFRMPSFMLRDQALAISGLLSPKVGGPAVKPYQPDGIWEEATFGKVKYTPDTGDALYRRSLYTFWRRIVGPTMFFDTAPRQFCVVKATRTNTPLQALVTMNETTYVEAARAMAQRLLLDASLKDDTARLTQAWRLATARAPKAGEVTTMLTSLQKLKAKFAADAEGAKTLLGVGDSKRDEHLNATEHAAWTSLCLMVLNLDEVLTKE